MPVSAGTVSSDLPSQRENDRLGSPRSGAGKRRLRIEFVVQHDDEPLDVPLRLYEATHDALYTVPRAIRVGVRQGMMVCYGRLLGPAQLGWGGTARVPSDERGFQTGIKLNLCMALLPQPTAIL